MKSALIDYIKRGPNDELYTPDYAVYPIIKYIPQNIKTIWCPFDKAESNFVKILQNNGYNVIFSHIENGEDFFHFEPENYDMIISNPPYSAKKKIIKRCYELNKPFALLLPITSLEGISHGKMFKKYGIGAVILDKRIDFNGKGKCWFNTSYLIHHKLYDGKIFFEEIKK